MLNSRRLVILKRKAQVPLSFMKIWRILAKSILIAKLKNLVKRNYLLLRSRILKRLKVSFKDSKKIKVKINIRQFIFQNQRDPINLNRKRNRKNL
jgi:hypothetical protein